MTRRIGDEMIGFKVGKLEVIELSHQDKNGSFKWLCKCECGNTKVISQGSLRQGQSLSCGCIQKAFTINRQLKHGMSHRPIYQTWLDMKKRCTNPKSNEYHNYGGRGIKISEKWINSFQNFFDDVGDIPFPNAQIDRIDNDGNYELGNIRWSTVEENQRNKRNNHLVTYKGETMCVADWAVRLGIKSSILFARLSKPSYTVEEAFTLPVHQGGCGRRHKSKGSCQVML